jgi:hypothetical protein
MIHSNARKWQKCCDAYDIGGGYTTGNMKLPAGSGKWSSN